MDRRYLALRVIATIVRILAWLALILGLLVAIGTLVAGFLLRGQPGVAGVDIGGPLVGLAAFFVGLFLSVLWFLFLYAGAEFIYLFLSIEENSRRTAYLLQQQYMPVQPAYQPPPETLDEENEA
jgi:hypothetical protein